MTLLPAFYGSYAVMYHHDFWLDLFGGSELRVLLWTLAPFSAFIGGVPAFVMHTYESWQVAPFRNPIEEEFALQDYNNGWMRAVVYKYIFLFESVAFLMAYHGYSGFGLAWVSLSLILLSYVGDQSKKVTFEVFGQPVFPAPAVMIPLFIWGVILNLFVGFDIAGHISSDGPIERWGYDIGALLAASGGFVEAVVAESTFNQLIHLGAVVLLITGSYLQGYFLSQAPTLFA